MERGNEQIRQKKMLKQRPGPKVRWRLTVSLQREEAVVTDTETDGPSQQDRQTEIHPPATASLSQKQRATLRYTQLETD